MPDTDSGVLEVIINKTPAAMNVISPDRTDFRHAFL
jgi:hypothetical protein